MRWSIKSVRGLLGPFLVNLLSIPSTPFKRVAIETLSVVGCFVALISTTYFFWQSLPCWSISVKTTTEELLRNLLASSAYYTVITVCSAMVLEIVHIFHIELITTLCSRPTQIHGNSAGVEHSSNETCYSGIEKFSVAHLSDLHVKSSDDIVTIEQSNVPVNSQLSLLLADNRDVICSIDIIIVSGDITDSGDVVEWNNFFKIVKPLWTEIQDRIVLVPGNHDVNIIHPKKLRAVESKYKGYRKARLARMLAAPLCANIAETLYP